MMPSTIPSQMRLSSMSAAPPTARYSDDGDPEQHDTGVDDLCQQAAAMWRQRQRHLGEIGVREHRRVAELTQHLVERHAMFEALDDMAAQLGPDMLPARHRRRHVAENGLGCTVP